MRVQHDSLLLLLSMIKILKRLLIGLIESRGYCVSFGEPATFAGIISGFRNSKNNFFFVQIGACDGKKSDPIHDFVQQRHWRGIMVEPQPDMFVKLQQSYAGCPGLVFENVVIASENGVAPFYRLKDGYRHLFHDDPCLLSSLSPDHILRHLSKPVDAAQALEVTQLPALTLHSLCAKYNVSKIDLLQIDAEGYDYEIIKMIDFSALKPSVIRFEHANLSPSHKIDGIELLLSHGYKLVVGRYDITAYQSQWMFD